MEASTLATALLVAAIPLSLLAYSVALLRQLRSAQARLRPAREEANA